MSLPVVFVGGNKGGVGKSLASMALIDYWLSQNPAKPVFLVETDTSNPDVAHAYGKTVPHYLPQIGVRLSLEPKRTLSDFATGKFLRFVRITQWPKFTLEDGVRDREVVPALNVDVLITQR